MSISENEFRAALSRFATGVTVVTAKDQAGRLHGITVSAFCSVSLEPPLILVCIEKEAGSHDALKESSSFVVNILHEDQQNLSDRFASLLDDKFDLVKYRPGIDELPVLEDALAALECRLKYSHEGGDHTIFVGEVEHATVRDGKALVHWQGNYREIKD